VLRLFLAACLKWLRFEVVAVAVTSFVCRLSMNNVDHQTNQNTILNRRYHEIKLTYCKQRKIPVTFEKGVCNHHKNIGVWFCGATRVVWWCDLFGGGGSVCALALQHAHHSHNGPCSSPYMQATDCITLAAYLIASMYVGDCVYIVDAFIVSGLTTDASRLSACK